MPGGDPTDEQLVSLSKDGNLDAFNSLVARYQSAVYGLCYRFVGEREAAEDAAQEAFIAAYRNIGRFHGGNFKAWLLRIAANEAKDLLRARRRRSGTDSLDAREDDRGFEPADPGAGAAERVEQRELGEAVELALQTLPFDQRQVVVLIDYFEFDYEEAARISGVSLGTVKSRLHRGRERLRRFVLGHPELFGRPGR